MGRELRRKQAKKEGKSLEKEEIKIEHPIRKLLIITIVILIVITLIYILSGLFVTKELKWFNNQEETEESETVTSAILASEIFNQSEEEYYVYFYDFDEKKEEITSLVESSIVNDKLYKVNTSSPMNAKYVSEESNKNAKTLSELKVKANTLIKISNGQIVSYHEGNDIIGNI